MQASAGESIEELISIRDMLRWAVTQFQQANLHYGHGTDNAWDEAVWLVFYALSLPLVDINRFLDARLTHQERRQIQHLIQRRIDERLPVAYLTNEAWFAGLAFYVDQRVLIPRSSLGELITQQFSPWYEADNAQHILDLCTGSGCIAIACAQALHEVQVDAVDISSEALAVAGINVQRYQLNDRVHLLQSDLFATVPHKKYDIIISNPPYVTAREMAELPKEYQHEPALGLAAGEDGLVIVHRILREAAQYLADDGILIVEVGNTEQNLVESYPDLPFTWLEFEQGEGGVFLLTAEQLKHVR